jgi:hypothetical protein
VLFLGGGQVKPEENEPMLRSCWECNKAHEHLKKVNTLHWCLECGRYWVFDRFLDSLENDEATDAFFSGWGVAVGASTTTVDAGYRLNVITLTIGGEEKT